MDFELPEVLASAPGMLAAELLVDGLAAFCFNRTHGEPFWEVAYPRPHHDLTIKIQELDGDGNDVGSPITHPVDRRVERFTIRLTNGSVAHYDDFPHGGPLAEEFHRDPAVDDPHDLQWMLDLADDEIDHGDFQGVKPRHPSRPRAVASIHHSLFCNLELEVEPARISPRAADDPEARDSFELGLTNTFIIGVLLATDPGEIEFEFHPGGLTINPLPYDENKRYRIEIINDDVNMPPKKHGFVKGDLHLFYDNLIDVSGPEKDLWAVPHPRASPDGDCHPTRFSGPTLEP